MYRNKARYDVAKLVPSDVKSVLEIGAGAGLNYVIYPKDAYKVAIEPENRTDTHTIDKVPGGTIRLTSSISAKSISIRKVIFSCRFRISAVPKTF